MLRCAHPAACLSAPRGARPARASRALAVQQHAWPLSARNRLALQRSVWAPARARALGERVPCPLPWRAPLRAAAGAACWDRRCRRRLRHRPPGLSRAPPSSDSRRRRGHLSIPFCAHFVSTSGLHFCAHFVSTSGLQFVSTLCPRCVHLCVHFVPTLCQLAPFVCAHRGSLGAAAGEAAADGRRPGPRSPQGPLRALRAPLPRSRARLRVHPHPAQRRHRGKVGARVPT